MPQIKPDIALPSPPPGGTNIPSVIAAALVSIQKDMKPLTKSETNDEYGSKFVPLDQVYEKAIELLQKKGIAVIQPAVTDENEHLSLETMLVHRTGVTFSRTTRLVISKADAQGHGASLTYTRRYALMGMLGLTAKDEDDDGNSASGKSLKPKEEQLEEIVSLLRHMKWTPDLIERDLKAIKTRDHAELAIRNYRQLAEKRVGDLKVVDAAKRIDVDSDDDASPQATLMARIKALKLASPAYENKLIFRATGKPFISKVKTDDELHNLDKMVTSLENGEYSLPAEFYAPRDEPITVQEDVA